MLATSCVGVDFAFYQATGNLVGFENKWLTQEGFAIVSDCKYVSFNW